MNNENQQHRLYLEKDHLFFKVPGAGEIAFGASPHCKTKGTVGFSFGVSWGRYGYVGGVLGREEAKRLANFILDQCKDIEETEAEELARFEKAWFANESNNA